MTRTAAYRKYTKAQVAQFAAEDAHAKRNTPWTRTVLEARQRDARIARRAAEAVAQ